MCNKSGDTYPPVIQFVPQCYKTQEMCDKFVSEDSFMPKYYLDGYKTQEMGDKSVDVDAFLSTLKFIPD